MKIVSAPYRLWLLLPVFLLIAAAWSWHPESTPPARPKSVILMIGDGMGLTQVSAGMYSHHNRLNLERFPVTGLIATQSSDHRITDSGAAATALACGCKTYNTAIGLDPKRRPCRTLIEQADSARMATGIVVTCSATHATPASFVAHVRDRSLVEEIATFFVKNPLDLLIAGGKKHFSGRTTDTRDLCQELRNGGCTVSDWKVQPFENIRPDTSQPFCWFSAEEEPRSAADGREYLPPATALAPDFLKKRGQGRGFFLMVEGSQIDWAGHNRDQPRLIAEVLDFDAAVGEALRFAEADGETLVVVTADHETGGVAIMQGSEMDSLTLLFTTKNHTASMVPVFAYGPGSERFGGVYENTGVYERIRQALGW